mgnify:FL=1
MATLMKINKVTSSADSTTNITYWVDLSSVYGAVTTATTFVALYSNDGISADTLTFTVTGGDPDSDAAQFLITDDAAGQKLKNVDRLSDWFMGAVADSKNSTSHKVLNASSQALITAQAGLTFSGATTEPLVSIVAS